MELDEGKIDRAVIALLYLGLNRDLGRAWKSFDWAAMNRLFEAELISDPKSKNKTIFFTEKGEAEAKQHLKDLFGK